MPYTRITRTRDGKAAIRYIMCKKGHNGQEARNEIVSGINLLPDAIIPFSVQMDKVWDKASSRNKIRVHRIVQSFSRKELDPDNPEDIAIAHEIGVRTAKELYGQDCQCIVATQNDGEGHLVHNHILVSNVTMNGTGLTNERTFHPTIRKTTDEITAQFIDLTEPEPAPEVVTPEVRGMRTGNADAAEGEARYIWQDDLRRRIRDAADAAKDMDDFFDQLLSRDVKGMLKKATKKQPEYILYELTDVSGFPPEKIPKNLKSKSYKMGLDYQSEEIEKKIREKQLEGGIDMYTVNPVTGVRTDLQPVYDMSTVKVPGEVERAEDSKDTEIRRVYRKYRGIPLEIPYMKDDFWGAVPDYDKARELSMQDDYFVFRFRDFQSEWEQQGLKFPPVFFMDEAGLVHLDRDALDEQVLNYIHYVEDAASYKRSTGAFRSTVSDKAEGEKKKTVSKTAEAKTVKTSAAGGTEKGRKDMKKKSKKVLTQEEREKRNSDTEELFQKVREIERKTREQEEDYELEF